MSKNKLQTFYRSFIEYIGLIYEQVFVGRSKWLYPYIFIIIILAIIVELITTAYDRIDMMLPRAFPDWGSFHIYVEESIIQILKDNNQTDWADVVFSALYVSQSYHERKGELLRALGALKCQPFVKQLGIKPAIEKSLSFLHSLGWIRVG